MPGQILFLSWSSTGYAANCNYEILRAGERIAGAAIPGAGYGERRDAWRISGSTDLRPSEPGVYEATLDCIQVTPAGDFEPISTAATLTVTTAPTPPPTTPPSNGGGSGGGGGGGAMSLWLLIASAGAACIRRRSPKTSAERESLCSTLI